MPQPSNKKCNHKRKKSENCVRDHRGYTLHNK
nr:MAG TPA: NADH dehydrogenase [Caudoviricetes sp.]